MRTPSSIVIGLAGLACFAALEPAGKAKRRRPEEEAASSPSLLDAAAAEVEAFRKTYRGRRAEARLAEILEAVAREVPEFAAGGESEDPLWRALRRIAADAEPPAGRTGKGGKPHPVRHSPAPAEAPRFPLPRALAYRFGERRFVSLDPKARSLNQALKAGRAPTPEVLPPAVRFEALFVGALPETEIVVADVERRLDVHDTADAYARFLSLWRNRGPQGDESFYEALDRTAGTDAGVFFLDAMLADFVQQFAAEEGKLWSRQEQHDKNQQAFLAYRQYRGFIEAVALSLVTPPDVPLPRRLERYDYGHFTGGFYSLRDQIDLLLSFHGDDAGAVVERVRAHLLEHRLPEKLWSGYDPVTSLAASIKEESLKEVQRLGLSTDALLERERGRRLALCERVRIAVRGVLDGR